MTCDQCVTFCDIMLNPKSKSKKYNKREKKSERKKKLSLLSSTLISWCIHGALIANIWILR